MSGELGTSPPGSGHWTQRRTPFAVVITAAAVLVAAVLTQAFVTIDQLGDELRASDRLSNEFVDAQRLFGQLEVALATADRLDDPAVVETTQLLARPVRIADSHRDNRDGIPGFVADIDALVALHDALVELMATDPTAVEAARALADEAERHAKTATDRVETATRQALTGQLDEVRLTAGRAAAVAVAVILAAVAILLLLRRRFHADYSVAYELALTKAAELERSNDELRAANETKQRFVSVVSHELRTPLTVIKGFTETLIAHRSSLTEPQRLKLFDAILRQAHRQERLVSDLLVAARHVDRPIETNPSALDLGALVHRLLAELPESGGRIEVLAEDACEVWVDPGHAEQILENLITNASKYGGGWTRVSWSCAGSTARILVEDDGPGVDPAFRDHLFKPFTQADSTDSRSSTGVGLGLSITAMLAAANDGSVSYADREGGGAVFEVLLPCGAREPAPEAEPAPVDGATTDQPSLPV